MTYDEIKLIFDSFIEFPDDSDKLTVTTTSCILFARHISALEREACAKVCDEVDKESSSQWPARLATMIRARSEA